MCGTPVRRRDRIRSFQNCLDAYRTAYNLTIVEAWNVSVMDETRAITALSELTQKTKLALFRLLVTAGPAGLPAGVIAERLRAT
jgi:hypothetical protein